MDVIKSNAWKGEGVEVPQNSFFFGLRDLTSDYYQVMIQKERPAWCKTLWLVITLGLVGFTGFVTFLMVRDFLQYGAYDKIVTVAGKNVTLPAITICNLNPINYTALVAALEEDNPKVLAEWSLLHEQGYEANLNQNSSASYLKYLKEYNAYENLEAYEKEHGPLTLLFKNEVTSLLSRARGIYDYSFNRNGLTIGNWINEQGVNELGSCIELNDGQAFKQTVSGSEYGFTIDLDAVTESYSPFTKSVGFKVFIHDHDETMFFDDGGYIVAPGTETFMEINLNKMKRLKSPWGTCADNKSRVSKFNNTLESRQECFNLAFLTEYLDYESCRCIPWFVVNRLMELQRTQFLDDLINDNAYYRKLDKKRKKRSWDEYDDDYYDDYVDVYGEDAKEWFDDYDSMDDYISKGTKYSEFLCNSYQEVVCEIEFTNHWDDIKSDYYPTCMEPCNYNRYDVSVSSSRFPPTEGYFDKLFNVHMYGKEPTYTWKYARENLVRLHIYYNKLSFRTNAQTKEYEPQNFIGELGGVVDLFIGFSFFTVFQLLEIGLAYLLFRCCGRKRPEEADNVTDIELKGSDKV